jgi:hypothetical protein
MAQLSVAEKAEAAEKQREAQSVGERGREREGE